MSRYSERRCRLRAMPRPGTQPQPKSTRTTPSPGRTEQIIAVSIPDYQTLMLPVLRLAAKGETRVPNVEQQLARDLGLTSEERDQLLPSGKQRVLHNRVHWAKFYLAKVGLVVSPQRGRFVASEAGRALLAAGPERIDVERLLGHPAFREFYRGEAANGAVEAASAALALEVTPQTTPEEQIETAYVALQSALRADLLARILENTPTLFEGVIVDLLVAM